MARLGCHGNALAAEGLNVGVSDDVAVGEMTESCWGSIALGVSG